MTRGIRKDGSATDHVAHQYLGSVGKIDNGIVAVTQAVGRRGALLPAACSAIHAGRAFITIVVDCFYGDNNALERARCSSAACPMYWHAAARSLPLYTWKKVVCCWGRIVRLYGLRNWMEQSYKQMKDELG